MPGGLSAEVLYTNTHPAGRRGVCLWAGLRLHVSLSSRAVDPLEHNTVAEDAGEGPDATCENDDANDPARRLQVGTGEHAAHEGRNHNGRTGALGRAVMHFCLASDADVDTVV